VTETSICPCGSGLAFDACCGPIISGATPAPTALALMRSRYSAYATGAIEHVRNTLCAAQRGDFDHEAATAWSRNSQWLGLEIHATEAGGEADQRGTVDFTASFTLDGVPQQHRERAEFRREDGAWVYEDGQVRGNPTVRRESPKVGRNDPCPCGSGKKFKKCCGQ